MYITKVEPLTGFSDKELLTQVAMQNDIMDNHEDYAGCDVESIFIFHFDIYR